MEAEAGAGGAAQVSGAHPALAWLQGRLASSLRVSESAWERCLAGDSGCGGALGEGRDPATAGGAPPRPVGISERRGGAPPMRGQQRPIAPRLG